MGRRKVKKKREDRSKKSHIKTLMGRGEFAPAQRLEKGGLREHFRGERKRAAAEQRADASVREEEEEGHDKTRQEKTTMSRTRGEKRRVGEGNCQKTHGGSEGEDRQRRETGFSGEEGTAQRGRKAQKG